MHSASRKLHVATPALSVCCLSAVRCLVARPAVLRLQQLRQCDQLQQRCCAEAIVAAAVDVVNETDDSNHPFQPLSGTHAPLATAAGERAALQSVLVPAVGSGAI